MLCRHRKSTAAQTNTFSHTHTHWREPMNRQPPHTLNTQTHTHKRTRNHHTRFLCVCVCGCMFVLRVFACVFVCVGKWDRKCACKVIVNSILIYQIYTLRRIGKIRMRSYTRSDFFVLFSLHWYVVGGVLFRTAIQQMVINSRTIQKQLIAREHLIFRTTIREQDTRVNGRPMDDDCEQAHKHTLHGVWQSYAAGIMVIWFTPHKHVHIKFSFPSSPFLCLSFPTFFLRSLSLSHSQIEKNVFNANPNTVVALKNQGVFMYTPHSQHYCLYKCFAWESYVMLITWIHIKHTCTPKRDWAWLSFICFKLIFYVGEIPFSNVTYSSKG